MTLNGKPVMLITGASRGIGAFLAEYFSQNGEWLVVGCSRSDSAYHHDNYEHIPVDITVESDILKMFAHIRATYGRVDALINNAGSASMNHALLTPSKTVIDLFQLNCLASFICSREAAKIMKRRRYGRIINFTTVAVPLALEGESAYVASKAAVEGLTRVLAREFSEFGITVNAIGPGPVQTDLIKNVPSDKLERLIERLGIRSYTDMNGILHTIKYFLSNQANQISGQIVYLGCP